MKWIQNRRQVIEYLISFGQGFSNRDLISLNILGKLYLLFETFTFIEFFLQFVDLQVYCGLRVVHSQENLIVFTPDPEGL